MAAQTRTPPQPQSAGLHRRDPGQGCTIRLQERQKREAQLADRVDESAHAGVLTTKDVRPCDIETLLRQVQIDVVPTRI